LGLLVLTEQLTQGLPLFISQAVTRQSNQGASNEKTMSLVFGKVKKLNKYFSSL